jgi:hypothetical protein
MRLLAIIKNRAGGAGVSTHIVYSLGRPIDVSINYDAEAVTNHVENGKWQMANGKWQMANYTTI